jgi:iron complex outermembrane recepter protein
LKTNRKLAYAITAALSACSGASYAAETGTSAISGIEEIVVTAQRRSESVQNVPITIQAVTGDQLGQLNATTFDDVLKILPNVTYANNGAGQGTIFMRGLSAGYAGGQSAATINPLPNVATYLDEQALTFPGHNLDVYMVDMERIEVLEGPQGTLFGGGAEAGVLRYITNKPKLNVTEGNAEASYGTTAHGDPNTSISGMVNVPLIPGKLAVRAVAYNDRRGGYIDNVPSTFTRNRTLDLGPSAYSTSYPARLDTYNNYQLAKKAQNPVTYQGLRVSGLYEFNDDWNALIQQTYQHMDADGMAFQLPYGLDFQKLNPLETTAFFPSWNRDTASLTAWTLNGKLGNLRAIYTGSYQARHYDTSMDYTNYTRTAGGFYYSCTGAPGLFGPRDPKTCFSPFMGWHDYAETTHQQHEVRLSTPDEWRLRGLVGAFWEDQEIKNNMNFLQKTIPSCTPDHLAAALAGGPVCIANVTPVMAAVDPTTRNDSVNFGEDVKRGSKQTAFFASLDFDIIPKVLTVTGGTRYYKYEQQLVGSKYHTTTGCQNKPNGSCIALPINYDDHHATYTGFKSRGNVTWHVTPDTMLYYTYSQGYRPGAFNRTAAAESKLWVDANNVALANGVDKNTVPGAKITKQFITPLVYKPDTLTNNEVGFKSEFLSRRLIVNASAYSMEWKDVQTLIYNPTAYGNSTFGLTGPSYKIKGFELQFTARVADAFTLMGSLSHNSAEQDTSPCIISPGKSAYGVNIPNNPTPAGACLTQVRAGSTNVALLNPLGAIGDTPAFSPRLQFNLRGRYDWTVDEYKAYAMVAMNHTDEMNNQPSGFTSGEDPAHPIPVPYTTWLRYKMPSYDTFDASFGVAKGAWDAQLYAQNLTNKISSVFTTSGQDVRAEIPLRPRVLGLKLAMKF